MSKLYLIFIILLSYVNLSAESTYVKFSNDSILIGTPFKIELITKILSNYSIKFSQINIPDNFFYYETPKLDTIVLKKEKFLRIYFSISSFEKGTCTFEPVNIIFTNIENGNFFIEKISLPKLIVYHPEVDTNSSYKPPYGEITNSQVGKNNQIKINNLYYFILLTLVVLMFFVLLRKTRNLFKNKGNRRYILRIKKILRKFSKETNKLPLLTEIYNLFINYLKDVCNSGKSELSNSQIKEKLSNKLNDYEITKLINIKGEIEKQIFYKHDMSGQEIEKLIEELLRLISKIR